MALRIVTLVVVRFPKPVDTIVMNRGEHKALSRCVEISDIVYSGPLDNTTWRERGTVVLFPDEPRSKGGSGGCVVRFYDPRFVLLHTNRGVVTEPDFHPLW